MQQATTASSIPAFEPPELPGRWRLAPWWKAAQNDPPAREPGADQRVRVRALSAGAGG